MNNIDILKKLKLGRYYINKYKKHPTKKLYKNNLELIKKYYQTKKKVQKGGSKVAKETNTLIKMIENLLNDKDVEINKIKSQDEVNQKKIKELEEKILNQQQKITSLQSLSTGERERYDQMKQLLHRFQDKILKTTKKSYWPLQKFKSYVKSMLKNTWKPRDESLFNFLTSKEISPYYVGSNHLSVKGMLQYIDKRKAPKQKQLWL